LEQTYKTQVSFLLYYRHNPNLENISNFLFDLSNHLSRAPSTAK